MRKCRTKVTNKSTLKKPQIAVDSWSSDCYNTWRKLAREKTSPPESIIKRLWTQLDPESSDPPNITGPPKVGSLTLNKPTSIKDRGPGSIAYLFPNDQYSGQIRMIIRMENTTCIWEQEKLKCKKTRRSVFTTFLEPFFCVLYSDKTHSATGKVLLMPRRVVKYHGV